MKKLIIMGVLLSCSLPAMAETVKYFGDLRYNHVSLHVPIKGIIPFDSAPLNQSHYQFRLDDEGNLVEIINHTYGRLRRHPLTHFGAYRVVIKHSNTQEIRRYFDIKNQPMRNIRGVHKEVFTLDKLGAKTQLDFYDVDNKPVESNWKISTYKWKNVDNRIFEQRVNLAGKAQDLSPYFAFKGAVIEYDRRDNPYRMFNVDFTGKTVNSDFGVAYYQDEYNEKEQHVKYSYFDMNDEPVLNPFGFSYAVKQYNEQGSLKKVDRYDLKNKFIPRQAIPPLEPASAAERKAIKQVAFNYILALQTLDPQLMANTLHKELAKNMVRTGRDGKKTLRNISYQRMLENAQNWNKSGTRFPPKMNNQATILDVYNNMAAVKLTSDNWVEYLHIIKIDGRWQIKDLVWDYNNI